MVKISSIFVAFLENMNFKNLLLSPEKGNFQSTMVDKLWIEFMLCQTTSSGGLLHFFDIFFSNAVEECM